MESLSIPNFKQNLELNQQSIPNSARLNGAMQELNTTDRETVF